MKALLLLLHLAGVIVWVGGMFFAHFCLRPVAALQLQPPQRLLLLSAVLGRFFIAVAVSIGAILISGLVMLLKVGMANAPWHWHAMLTTGLVMTGIFGYICFVHYPRLKARIAAEDWPTAGASMNSIRHLVAINLAIGAATVAIVIVGKYF